MCGRFVQAADLDHWVGVFDARPAVDSPLPPSWNVAPTDPVYAVAEHRGERLVGSMRWGLVPPWADDARTIHINARAETVATKPAFRDSFRYRRCLIPADGFYEWQQTGRGKIPHHVDVADGDMAFAGIWNRWTDPTTGEAVRTCAIITTDAAPEIAGIHDRMPVWLPPDTWDDWLDRNLTDPDRIGPVLDRASPGRIVARPIGDAVGSVANNGPELLADRQDLFS